MRTIPRTEAIRDIRREILLLVDDDHSMCQVAARLGIYCHGFRQFSDEELMERYQWLVRRRGETNREALEELANRWQLARQLVRDEELSCDVQAVEHDTCLGWDGFTDERLEEFYRKLCNEEVRIGRGPVITMHE